MNGKRRHRRGEAGQSMLEYAMIVVFVAMAGYAAWRSFGTQIRGLVEGSANAVERMGDSLPAEAGR